MDVHLGFKFLLACIATRPVIGLAARPVIGLAARPVIGLAARPVIGLAARNPVAFSPPLQLALHHSVHHSLLPLVDPSARV